MSKETFGTILAVALFALFFGVIGLSIGFSNGSNAAWEAMKKSDCQFEYSSKPVSEVPVKCLKYFDVKQK